MDTMKAYLAITGIIFILITLAHVVRIVFEPHLATEPVFLALTFLTAGLACWAGKLFWR